MNLGEENQNISSLNIFTFIKEIYQSIKNFHKKLDNMSTQQKEFRNYIERVNKEHEISMKKMQEIITRLSTKLDNKEEINVKLRTQLENKLGNLMAETIDHNEKLHLNINELTIGNLVDNNYNLNDINEQLNSLNNDDNSDNIEFIDNRSACLSNYSINGIENKSNNIINNDINTLINSINSNNSFNDNNEIDNNNNINQLNNDENDDENEEEDTDINNLDYQIIKNKNIDDLIFN